MFYNYRKIIYLALILLVLFTGVFIKLNINDDNSHINKIKVESSQNVNDINSPTNSPKDDSTKLDNKNVEVTNTPIISGKHENYNKKINLVGKDYDFTYKITNAKLIDNGTLNFDLNILANKDKKIVKVDMAPVNLESGSLLDFKTIVTKAEDQMSYSVLNLEDVKVVDVRIIVFTKELYLDKQLEYNTLPFGSTKLDLNSLIKEAINGLKKR